MKDPIAILRGESESATDLEPLPGGFDEETISDTAPVEFERTPYDKTDITPKTLKHGQESDSLGGYVGFGTDCTEENDDSDLPPLQLLPPVVARFTLETARVAQVPSSMALVPVLGALTTALGAGVRIETYARRTLPANLYLILAAKSGTGKDECYRYPLAPLQAIEADRLEVWHDDTLPGLLGDLARVTAKLKALDREKPSPSEEDEHRTAYRELSKEKARVEKEIASEPSLIENDITRERLIAVMSAQPGEALASITSEARGVVSVVRGRYNSGSTDEDLYAGAFSGTPVKSNRMSRSDNLKCPCLSLVWALQPDAMREMLGNTTMVESGFLPRCLLIDPQAEPADVPDEFPAFSPELVDSWESLITSLVQTFHDGGKTPITVKTSPDAYEMLRAFDNETKAKRRSGGEYADVASFAARWPEIAWRLALVFHCARNGQHAGGKNVDQVDAEAAIAVVRWFANETLKLLSEGRLQRKRERYGRLIELITGSGENSITLRLLKKNHGYSEREVLQLAETFGGFEVHKRQNPNGGPASPVALISSSNQ